MDPRVWKRGRRLQLSYDLPLRIHSTHVCSHPSPNGSTVIIYGHEKGLRILWRGGRRRRTPHSQSQPNGNTKSQDIIVLDDDDELSKDEQTADHQDVEYEEEEDDLDPDCPYPPIIEEVDIELDSAVLQLAIPSAGSFPNPPGFLRSHVLACVACADGTIAVLTLPLIPPLDVQRLQFTHDILQSRLVLNAEDRSKPIARSLAAKLLPVQNDSFSHTDSRSQQSTTTCSLLVASASQSIRVDRLTVNDGHLSAAVERAVSQWPIPSPATMLAFHPSPKTAQLLVADTAGSTRVFDPEARVYRNRPSSQDAAINSALEDVVLGKWIMTYVNPSAFSSDSTHRQRRTLAARFILGGSAILALLEDGEWGVWDLSGSSSKNKDVSGFVLQGFLGTSTLDSSDNLKHKKRLAPMTPNTRKVKAANFFSGSTRSHGAHARGGISIASSVLGRGGQPDESVLLWYESEIYTIPSTQVFWQRAQSHNTSGSLHSPNLTQINDVNLMNEKITSVSQLGSKQSSAGLGHMNTQRDVIVSTEFRLTVLQTLSPPAPSKALFQETLERPASRDQQMLDAGELDVGGIDRLLDTMADTGARPRRVGFAR